MKKNRNLSHAQFIRQYAVPAGQMLSRFKKHRDANKRYFCFVRYSPERFAAIKNPQNKPFIWKGNNCAILHTPYWLYLWMNYRIIRNNICGIKNPIIEIQLIKLKNEKHLS